MADYRQIHTSIWDDDWFCQLSSDEKVVFIWLFSNRRASVSGLYQFTEFICSRETGLPKEIVRKAIQQLINDGKIYVEDDWVWVKNLRKYNYYKNGNADVRIRKDLEQIPDNGLKQAYIEYYKPLDSPCQAPTTPLQEQEHDIEHENENEIKRSSDDDFSFVQKTIEQLTGYPPNGSKGIEAIQEIVSMGAMVEDIKAGIKWLAENGKTCRYYQYIVNPTRTAMSMRLNPKPVNKKYKPLEDLKFDNVGVDNGK